MKKCNFNRAQVLVAIAFTLLTPSVHADILTGRVVGIADGDTLTLLDTSNIKHKIRLAGIDSPEKGQPFGQACKMSLSDLAYDRVVAVESNKLDRYGRVIGKVLVNGQSSSPRAAWRSVVCSATGNQRIAHPAPENRVPRSRQDLLPNARNDIIARMLVIMSVKVCVEIKQGPQVARFKRSDFHSSCPGT